MSSWFTTLGWWQQHDAYAAFDWYRSHPTQENFEIAVTKAIPIIRIVISTQKFKIMYKGDEEDFVSHAALTITKALPKMIKKDVSKLDDDKKYMRYLFTCVVNAFYREYDILHGKHNKLQRKINNNFSKVCPKAPSQNIEQLEVALTLRNLPKQLYKYSLSLIRFKNNEYKVCVYILQQLMSGREISKAVLHLLGCKNRPFFISYCNNLLYRAFVELKNAISDNEIDYDEFYKEEDNDFISLLDYELVDFEDYSSYSSYGEDEFVE